MNFLPNGYVCCEVGWEDVSRGVNAAGALSCVGPNITDVWLKGKQGESYQTIRSENWNERIGKVSSNKVAIVFATDEGLMPITLRDWLKTHDYYNASCDTEVRIRFQTVFLKEKAEFCVEHYNYQTSNNKDPKNLLLFCTSQGCSLAQDTCGRNKLYKVKRGDDGELYNHWFEVEASSHAVGGEQTETHEERQDALSRGKATASVIGIEAMGTRFNVVMSVQIPLAQQYKVIERQTMISKGFSANAYYLGPPVSPTTIHKNLVQTSALFGGPFNASSHESVVYRGGGEALTRGGGGATSRSSAARVSHGSRVGHFQGVHTANRTRHADEHITITVTMYYTADGGIPSEEDMKKACDDLDKLYKSCYWDGKLGDDEVKKAKLVHNAVEEVKKYNVFPL